MVISKIVASFGVVIEALATLLSEPLCVDHSLQQDTRTVLGVARAGVQGLLDGEARI